MDENRKKTKISEDPELINRILGPLGFSDIQRNKKNTGKNVDRNDIGFDFTAKKDRKDVKIEVKASTFREDNKIKGIPDSVVTEFELDEPENPKFKPDFLLVIGLTAEAYDPEVAYLLTKEEVNKFEHKIKKIVVFNSKLITCLRNAESTTQDGNLIVIRKTQNTEDWKVKYTEEYDKMREDLEK